MQSPAPSAVAPQETQLAPSSEEMNWLLALHLSPLLMSTSIPFANIIAPLIIWLIKREQFTAINEHGKAVLNFQIAIGIVGFVCMLLLFVLIGSVRLPLFVLIGWVLLRLILIFNLVMIVQGAMDAQKGRLKRFPFSLNLIK